MTDRVVWNQPPFTIVDWALSRAADWYEPLPQFLDGDVTQPTDLAGKRVEVFIRPTYDHAILLMKLSTEDGSISIDEASEGRMSFNVQRQTLSALPLAVMSDQAAVYDWFCVESEPETSDPADGRREFERWRGRLSVYPARLSA